MAADLDALRAERLAALREQTADRPAHAYYLEALIAWYEAGDLLAETPEPGTDVSWAVQCAIDDDVEQAYHPGRRAAVWGDYRRYRADRARAAARARETRRRLGDLLP